MKKSLPLFAATWLFALQMQAQITLHASDFNFSGSAVLVADTFSNFNPGGTGEQFWDFTDLEVEYSYPTVFGGSQDVPFETFFPLANSASVWSAPGSGHFQFFHLDEQSLKFLGRHRFAGYTSIVTHTQVDSGESLIRFPATFGDNWQEDFEVVKKSQLGSPPVDSFHFILETHNLVSADAWGVLSTPTGSYEVLRFTKTSISLDSTFNYSPASGTWTYAGAGTLDTLVSYQFWTNQTGLPVPVLQVELKQYGFASAYWLKEFTSKAAETALPQVGLFPNPASDWLTVEVPEHFEGRLEILDFLGRLAFSKQMAGVSEQVNVSALPTGAYLAVLRNRQGELADFQRFAVKR